MVNLIENQKKVNPQQEKLEKELIYMLLRDTPMAAFAGKDLDIDSRVPWQQWAGHGSGMVEGCPLAVPVSLQDSTRQLVSSGNPRRNPSEVYPQLAEELRGGCVSNGTLDRAADSFLQRRPLVLSVGEDGSGCLFRGVVRGCKEYAERMGTRLSAAAAVLAALPGTAVFVTITYDIAANTTDILEAMAIHKGIVDKWLRHARALGRFEYICVVEQTTRGYPHVHILGKWVGMELDGQWVSTTRSKHGKIIHGKELWLKDVDFFYRVKSWQPAPQFRLVLVEERAVTRYICKYISKGMESGSKGKGEKSRAQLLEERKSKLCYMVGYMSHGRQARISQGLRQSKEQPVPMVSDKDRTELRERTAFEMSTPEGENVLISLLNKLTSSCRTHLFIVFSSISSARFEGDIGYHETLDPALLADVRAVGVSMGCPGCVVTKWLDSLRDKSSFDSSNIHKSEEQTVVDRVSTQLKALFALGYIK